MEDDIPSVQVSALNPLAKRVPIDVLKTRLPIFNYRNEILYLLECHQVLIIKGETGCGKSTQIPQYLVEAGWHINKDTSNNHNDSGRPAPNNLAICISEPRRAAAIALAKRVAEETNSILGHEIGYAVRTDRCYRNKITCVKYVTDGLLVREMMSDPLLDRYSVVMVDEAHERNMYTDLLMALLKRIIIKRDDLRIIVCSATLDIDRFVTFFTLDRPDCSTRTLSTRPAVLCVEGRTYPSEIFFSSEPVSDYVKASANTATQIHEMHSMTSGDILIFLTGQDEIEDAMSILKEYSYSIRSRIDIKRLIVLPLYASLTSQEFSRVLEPAGKNSRKCIISTNVAETSLTIDGIAFVIDCGFVKLRFHNPATKSDTLVRVPISKAAAEQRAGRAGRTKAGQSYRLYTEDSYDSLNPFTIPEIQRCALGDIIVQLKLLGIGNIVRFDMPTKMPIKNVISALEHLHSIKAIDSDGELGQDGATPTELALDPQLSKYK